MDEAPGRLPDFLIVGAMKAGTTSLAAWLAEHPDVHIPPQKEVGFFNEPYHWWLGVDWYRSQFAGAGAAAVVGDATPIMSNEIAVGHLAEVVPGARLVAVLRDPAERAYSHYWHIRAQGDERRSFLEAVAAEAADPPAARGAIPRDYVHRSRYGEQVGRLHAVFGPDQLLVLLFDELRDDPVATFGRVCRFIGVDDATVPAAVGTVHNPRPAARSTGLAARTRRRLSRLVGRRGSAEVTRQIGPGGYPPMTASERAAVLALVDADVRHLERLIGRDLSAWRS
jgi:hypothetical protein